MRGFNEIGSRYLDAKGQAIRSNQCGFDDRGFHLGEERVAQIPFAGIADERHDHLALDSGRAATCSAAHTFAPDEMPTSMPFFARQPARRCDRVVIDDPDHFVVHLRVEDLRHEARRRSLAACAVPVSPPESTSDCPGSTVTIVTLGLRCFEHLPDTGDRAAVPTPATTTSTLPSVSRQISSAVVRTVDLRIGRVSNCCGMKYLAGLLSWISLALAIAPFIPSAPGVRTSLRTIGLEQVAALDRHRVGHREDQRIALGRRDERERDPGVAAGRLHDDRVGTQPAVALGRLDHRDADAILDAPGRIERFELDENGRRRAPSSGGAA